MEEKLRIFSWIVGSGGFFGVLGAGFGSLTGALYWQSGKASGTRAGLLVARAFARAAGRKFSRFTQGAIVGAVDGFLFLGVLGAIAGAVGVYSGKVRIEMVGPVTLGALLLVGGAVFFGSLAYGVNRGGVVGLAAVFGGAVVGAFIGFVLARSLGLLIGLITGVVAGNLGMLVWGHYAPEFREPHLDASRRKKSPRSSTEVTETPDPTREDIQEAGPDEWPDY